MDTKEKVNQAIKGEVCDFYNHLLDEAFYLVATRKDGEDSYQC